MANLIVITNRSGAARYDEDVPLPSKYKVGPTFDVDEIHALLVESLGSYVDANATTGTTPTATLEEGKTAKGTEKGDTVEVFGGYRDWIAGQEGRMMVCVQRLVAAVGSGRRRKDAVESLSSVVTVP